MAVVGDSVHDLAMGRAAGAGLVIGFVGGGGVRELLAPTADHVIERLEDLAGLIKAE
jgi:phosphoglycolate phosphatase